LVLFLLPALTAAVPSPHTCRLVDAIPFFNFDKERSSIEDNNDLTILTEFARFMNHKVPAMLEEFANLKNILNIGPVENFQPGKDQTAANLRMPKNLQFEIGSLFDMADGLTREQQAKLFFSKPEATTATTTTTTPETPDDESADIKESIKKVVNKVVESMKDVVDTIKSKPLSVSSIKSIFAGIIDGVKKTLNDAGIPLPSSKPTDSTTEKPETETEISFFAKWPLVCKALWYPYDSEKCRTARCMACAPAMMASAQVCKRSEGVVSQRCLSLTLGDGFCNYCVRDYSETEYEAPPP